jgi:hypothetical protein
LYWKERVGAKDLAGQLAEKLLLVHSVFERLAAVDEDHGNFVVKLATEVGVGVHVDLAPGKASAARELAQAFLYDFAKMTSLTGIHHNAARLRHAGRF